MHTYIHTYIHTSLTHYDMLNELEDVKAFTRVHGKTSRQDGHEGRRETVFLGDIVLPLEDSQLGSVSEGVLVEHQRVQHTS